MIGKGEADNVAGGAFWRNPLCKAVNRLNAIASWACYGFLGIITTVICVQVFLRFVLSRPTSWSEEIALLCLIWFGLLAIAIGIRRHEHVAITFLRDMLPMPLAIGLDYLAQLLMGLFMLVVMVQGQHLVALAGIQILPASGLQKSLLYMPTVVGGGLGLINALTNIVLRDVGDPNHSIEEIHAD